MERIKYVELIVWAEQHVSAELRDMEEKVKGNEDALEFTKDYRQRLEEKLNTLHTMYETETGVAWQG